jgi:hypothetical protein
MSTVSNRLGKTISFHGAGIQFRYRDGGITRWGDSATMKSVALLMVVLLATSCAATARPYHGHGPRTMHHANTSSDRESHSGITCEMVRAYVAQVGVARAVAMAQSGGITSSEMARARRCLAEKS